MELERALHELSEIRGHIAKTEVYQGLKSIPLALTGIGAFLAASLQPIWVPAHSPVLFIRYWAIVAILNILIFSFALIYNAVHNTALERQITRRILIQFCPCLCAGGIITLIAIIYKGDIPSLMPGIWSTILSLGIFSSRPYLPSHTLFLGAYYFIAGLVFFIFAPGDVSLIPWGMGAVFGIGQLFAAFIFYKEPK